VLVAIAIAGCGSDDNSSSNAPVQQTATSSGGTSMGSAAVSAKGRVTPASLCTSEGKGKPKKQCTAGLTKLNKGKVSNPKAACKGLSKKKTKGVRGKSPFAVCIKAAAKLMAAKTATGGSGNGAADTGGSSGSADDSSGDSSSADSSSADDAEPICRDANGKTVPFDSEDVEECDVPPSANDSSDGSGSSSSDDGSSSDDSSSDDSSDDQ
jgi:hypothetical protein